MTTARKNFFFWLFLADGALALFLCLIVAFVVYRHGQYTTDPGWKPDIRDGHFYVTELDPDGVAASLLQENDRIVSVNGHPPRRSMGLRGSDKINMSPGTTYTLTIYRNNREQQITLPAGARKSVKNLICVLAMFSASFISFFIALLIGLSKPEERMTQAAALMGLSIGFLQLIATLEPMESFFGTYEIQLGHLIWLFSFSPLSIAFAFDFFHRFPSDPEGKSRWRYVKYLLYIWSGALFCYFTVVRATLLISVPQGVDYAMRRVEKFAPDLDVVLNPLMLIALPITCAVIAWNYTRIKDEQNRYRIRWITYGAVIGITPTILYFLLQTARNVWGQTWITHASVGSVFLASNLILTIVPIAIAYAIIKHSMFGITVALRLGFQYLLAKHVLQLLIYLPPVILVLTILSNRETPIVEILFSNTVYVLLTVAALIGLKFRTAFLEWLDRRFFREAYQSEKILSQLIEDIEDMNSFSEIARAVSVQVDSALHPKRLFVFYLGPGNKELILGHSSGGHQTDLRISTQSSFLRAAENESMAQPVIFYRSQNIPREELDWIESLDVQLVVPVSGSNQRLVGLLLLGEKRSEEAYTPQDRKMLKSVARQIGVVYENLLLKQKVDRGVKVQQEVLTHLQQQNRNLLRECPQCGTCYDSTQEFCNLDQSELTLTLPVDRVIDEKYRLERLLGKGGMGAVYEALDLRLQRRVAVKLLVGSMFGDRMALARFEREARASAKMNHPNIVSIYDFGGIEGKGAYLILELLAGSTLRAVLKQRKNLDPQTAAAWFDQIFKAVKAAHSNGIIHRDLKPENIFVSKSEDGQPLLKLLDLGLAKMQQRLDVDTNSLTAPGTVLGTIYYMSPEQIAGIDVDERSDIFSLGVMIVEALTGQQPFTGNSMGEIVIQIVQKQFNFPGYSPEVATLNDILQKCIAKNRNDRFSSISQMQDAIIPAIAACPPFRTDTGPAPLADTMIT